MNFQCEDLAPSGVRLIPRGSPAFQTMLADIVRHIENPPGHSPAGAILWNRSGKPICAFTSIWKYRWTDVRGEARTARSTNVYGVGHLPSLLLPFGLSEDRRPFELYWHTILPESKRYLDFDCMLGSNADVRPPAPEERWRGGVIRSVGRARGNPGPDIHTATLALDAVFFSTGECAGPDTRQLFEQITAAAEVYREVAAAACGGAEAGFDSERILAGIEKITGKARDRIPPPPNRGAQSPAWFRERELGELAGRISQMRTHTGDAGTVSIIRGWGDAVIPRFRRS